MPYWIITTTYYLGRTIHFFHFEYSECSFSATHSFQNKFAENIHRLHCRLNAIVAQYIAQSVPISECHGLCNLDTSLLAEKRLSHSLVALSKRWEWRCTTYKQSALFPYHKKLPNELHQFTRWVAQSDEKYNTGTKLATWAILLSFLQC